MPQLYLPLKLKLSSIVPRSIVSLDSTMADCSVQESKGGNVNLLTSWQPSEHEPLLLSILDFPKALISLIGSYLPVAMRGVSVSSVTNDVWYDHIRPLSSGDFLVSHGRSLALWSSDPLKMKAEARLPSGIDKMILLNDDVCTAALFQSPSLQLICTRTLEVKGQISDPRDEVFRRTCSDLLLLTDGRLVYFGSSHLSSYLSVWNRPNEKEKEEGSWWSSALDCINVSLAFFDPYIAGYLCQVDDYLVVCCRTQVQVFDIKTWKLERHFPLHHNNRKLWEVSACLPLPEGRLAIRAEHLDILSIPEGTCLRRIKLTPGLVPRCVWPDGLLVCGSYSEALLVVCDPETGEQVLEMEMPAPIFAAARSKKAYQGRYRLIARLCNDSSGKPSMVIVE